MVRAQGLQTLVGDICGMRGATGAVIRIVWVWGDEGGLVGCVRKDFRVLQHWIDGRVN